MQDSLGDAAKKISDAVSFKYPGAQTSIKLNSLRNMQIVVVGFVDVPGIYTLPGNASVLSALRLAEVFPIKAHSVRSKLEEMAC